MKTVKIITIVFSFILLASSLCHAEPEITTKWKGLVEQYKSHIVNSEWERAIKTAETLVDMDPSSSEAMFYLVYAYKKFGRTPPSWVRKPSEWAYGTVDDRFYRELAKEITK